MAGASSSPPLLLIVTPALRADCRLYVCSMYQTCCTCDCLCAGREGCRGRSHPGCPGCPAGRGGRQPCGRGRQGHPRHHPLLPGTHCSSPCLLQAFRQHFERRLEAPNSSPAAKGKAAAPQSAGLRQGPETLGHIRGLTRVRNYTRTCGDKVVQYLQAANAAASAEGNAMGSANHARIEQSMASLAAAMAAMALFAQVRSNVAYRMSASSALQNRCRISAVTVMDSSGTLH